MAQRTSNGAQANGACPEGRIAVARRFIAALADSGEAVRFGEITVHVHEGRVWLEVRKTFK